MADGLGNGAGSLGQQVWRRRRMTRRMTVNQALGQQGAMGDVQLASGAEGLLRGRGEPLGPQGVGEGQEGTAGGIKSCLSGDENLVTCWRRRRRRRRRRWAKHGNKDIGELHRKARNRGAIIDEMLARLLWLCG